MKVRLTLKEVSRALWIVTILAEESVRRVNEKAVNLYPRPEHQASVHMPYHLVTLPGTVLYHPLELSVNHLGYPYSQY